MFSLSSDIIRHFYKTSNLLLTGIYLQPILSCWLVCTLAGNHDIKMSEFFVSLQAFSPLGLCRCQSRNFQSSVLHKFEVYDKAPTYLLVIVHWIHFYIIYLVLWIARSFQVQIDHEVERTENTWNGKYLEIWNIILNKTLFNQVFAIKMQQSGWIQNTFS